jgi:hypothetical protein
MQIHHGVTENTEFFIFLNEIRGSINPKLYPAAYEEVQDFIYSQLEGENL